MWLLSHLFLQLLLAGVLSADLLFTQVWFRHGARAPSHYKRFPAEPVDFGNTFPYHNGELTKNGRINEHNIGTQLRAKYDTFLGPSYDSAKVRIYFDSDNRTSESAQLVAFGLFPATNEQKWSDSTWQPIPIHEKLDIKKVSLGLVDECPDAVNKLRKTQEFNNIMLYADHKFISFLMNKTGVTKAEVSDPKLLNDVVDSLYTRAKINDSRLPVPKWLDEQVYGKLENMTNYLHLRFMHLTMTSSGYWHINTLLSEFEDYINRPAESKNKMVLFSGHDTNLLTLGVELGITELSGKLPTFGSHIAFELHNISGNLEIRAFFAKNDTADLLQYKMKHCGVPCFYNKFVNIFKAKRISDEGFSAFCKNEDINTDVKKSSTIAWLIVTIIISVTINLFFIFMNIAVRIRERKRLGEMQPLLASMENAE